MYIKGIIVLILIVSLNKYLLDFIMNKIFGKQNYKKKKKLTSDYMNSMLDFFKAKGTDKIPAAEKALILQRQFGFQNAGKVLAIGIYVTILIKILNYFFANKQFLFLPIFGSLGWGYTLLLLVILKVIIIRILKRFQSNGKK